MRGRARGRGGVSVGEAGLGPCSASGRPAAGSGCDCSSLWPAGEAQARSGWPGFAAEACRARSVFR